MAAHAKLSASGSKRWIECPASVKAEAGFPNSTNIYADEGTAAHILAERCFTYNKPAIFFLGEQIQVGSNIFTVDEDMVCAVQVYVDYCNNISAKIKLKEKRVCYDKWVPEGFGTSDFIAIEEDKKEKRQKIHVVDLKYGKGVMVDALDNSQAMLYGLGTIQTLGFIYSFDENDVVICTIVQPRLDHISEFSITVGDLLRWADKVILPAVKAAYSDNPPYNPGEDQCRWCKAKGSCVPLAEDMFKKVSEDFTVIGEDFALKDKTKMSPEQRGFALRYIPMMKDWAKALEAETFQLMVEKNLQVPGYKIVKGKAGNRKWDDEEETIEVLTKELKIKKSEVIVSALKTPAVIEKLLKAKKIDPEKMKRFVKPKKKEDDDPNLLWSQPEGNPTIAKESDKREAITVKPSVSEDFTAIT